MVMETLILLLAFGIGYYLAKAGIEECGVDVKWAKEKEMKYGRFCLLGGIIGAWLIGEYVNETLAFLWFIACLGGLSGAEAGLGTVRKKAYERKRSRCIELRKRLDEIDRQIQQIYKSKGRGGPIADLGRQASILKLEEERERIIRQLKEEGC